MPRARTPIFSFNGGELSRRMEGRSDLDGIWDRALAKMLNYVATVEGPATKRPGFKYIKEAASSSTWLTRFVFNSTQAYVLEWLEGKVRFFTNGGRIELAGVPYELPVPYTADEAPRISSSQSFDRLYLAHANHFPGMISRNSAETFAYAPIPLKNGPFKDWNTDKTKRVSWSGSGVVGGVATLTADFNLFQAGHVGAPFIVQVESYADVKAWEPNVKTQANDPASAVTVGELCKSDDKIYKCISTGGSKFTGTVEPTHTFGAEWDGAGGTPIDQTNGSTSGVEWEYQHDRYGIGTITNVISPTEATITVTRALPTLSPDTHFWAHGCFSDVEGYPQLVGNWGGRLIFIKGVEIIASVVADFWNMAPLNDDGLFTPDMAFRLALNISDPPTWMHIDKEYLLLGTHSEEIVVGQINLAAGISSVNVRAAPQSAYGCADVWPAKVGTAVIFVQRGGRRLREAQFDYYQGRFVGANTNVYARHISRSGLKWLAWQQEPEELLWAGRGDGTLIAHPHSPEQQIKGFSRVELAQGTVLSGVAIPSDDGTIDDLWILADIDGAKGVLQLADFWDEDAGLEQADAFFVDWGVSYDGTGAGEGGADVLKQSFTSGLSHLEGKQVRVLFDGAETNKLTVTGGSIELPAPALKVHIGLGYQARLQLLPTESRGTPSARGLRQRARRLWGRVITSGAFSVVNRLGEMIRMWDRSTSVAMGKAPDLYSGDTENRPIGGGGSDYSDQPEIVSDDALPSIITLLVPTVQFEEPAGD